AHGLIQVGGTEAGKQRQVATQVAADQSAAQRLKAQAAAELQKFLVGRAGETEFFSPAHLTLGGQFGGQGIGFELEPRRVEHDQVVAVDRRLEATAERVI